MTLFKNLPSQREPAAEIHRTPRYFHLDRDRENGRLVHLMLGWPDTDRLASPVWSYCFDTLAQKKHVLDALKPIDLTVALWGRLAMMLGPEPVNAIFDQAVEQQREYAKEQTAKARKKAEARRQVDLYYLERKGRYWLELTRKSEDKAEWTISFAGKSERDRLCDWMRWQKPRFLAFLDHVAAHGEESLNAMLFDEMFETERRVKKEGKGAGGVRPLRMWRGM